jgi:hypothetical protein
MSSIFDTAVYQMRKGAPFTSPQMGRFIREKALYAEGPVVLTATPRPSVASRVWYTLEWYEDRDRMEVSAQELDLCFWRAIQLHKQKERQRELEQQPATKGPGIFAAEAKGWEQGDGI